MIYNFAICDDNIYTCRIIATEIKKNFELHHIHTAITIFTAPKSLLKAIEETFFHAYFLDIDMPECNGIDLTKQIMSIIKDDNIPVIYISNKDEMVYSALQTRPLRFIRKSRFSLEIQDAVTAIVDFYHSRKDYLTIERNREIVSLPMKQIKYIESVDKSQIIHIGSQAYTIHSKLRELENKLKPYGFLRVHKSYLVNYLFIFNIENEQIQLDDKTTIPMSRHRCAQTKNDYLQLIQKHTLFP